MGYSCPCSQKSGGYPPPVLESASSILEIDRTPAAGRPALARNLFDILREVVIDRQLFTLADGPAAHIQNVPLPYDRPDIGVAAVIDVLSTAAADRAVESPIIVERE